MYVCEHDLFDETVGVEITFTSGVKASLLVKFNRFDICGSDFV